MYEGHTSLSLKITEYINLGVTILFLLLFCYRFYALRKHSSTNRYQSTWTFHIEYFPKVRIFLSLGYILLSIALLVYNIVTDSYDAEQWYEYILQGGGGECINSGILLMELAVLRL